MTLDPRQHLNGRWTEDVWSGLKLFAESGMELLEPLKFAARSLPRDEGEQWIELLTRLEVENQGWKESIRASDARFVHLIRALNREWFLPRGTILMRTMRRCEHGHSDLWDEHGVGIGLIISAASYPLEGEPLWSAAHRRPAAVACYQIRWVFPNGLGLNAGQHDGAVPGVVLSLDRVDETAKSAGLVLPEAAQDARAKVLPHTRTAVVTAWREHGQLMRRRYPNVAAYANMLLGHIHVREAREAMNYARAEREPDEFPDTNLGRLRFFERLVEALLTENGSVRQRLWPFEPWGEVVEEDVATAAIGQPCPPEWRAKMDRACALSRLSAELTAAAVGPDPLLSASEWARELRVFAAETAASGQTPDASVEKDFAAVCGHGDVTGVSAMTWAVSLLADELSWRGPDRGPPLRELTHGDVCRAAEAAQRLVKEMTREIRPRLKALYGRQFNRPIDESPFATIDAAGLLRSR